MSEDEINEFHESFGLEFDAFCKIMPYVLEEDAEREMLITATEENK
jgi:hypothetical protein